MKKAEIPENFGCLLLRRVEGVGFCRLVRSMSRKDLTPQTREPGKGKIAQVCVKAGSDPSNSSLVLCTSRESAESDPDPLPQNRTIGYQLMVQCTFGTVYRLRYTRIRFICTVNTNLHEAPDTGVPSLVHTVSEVPVCCVGISSATMARKGNLRVRWLLHKSLEKA